MPRIRVWARLPHSDVRPRLRRRNCILRDGSAPRPVSGVVQDSPTATLHTGEKHCESEWMPRDSRGAKQQRDRPQAEGGNGKAAYDPLRRWIGPISWQESSQMAMSHPTIIFLFVLSSSPPMGPSTIVWQRNAGNRASSICPLQCTILLRLSSMQLVAQASRPISAEECR
jgi:hypothetical protein